MDADLRTLERRVRESPGDGAAWESYDRELARAGRPTFRLHALAGLASSIEEVGLARDPWKMIVTPCCGRAPRWTPPSFHGADFTLTLAAMCPPAYRYGVRSEHLAAEITEQRAAEMRTVVAPKCGRKFLEVSFRPETLSGTTAHALDLPQERITREQNPVDFTPPYRGGIHPYIVRTILRELPGYWAKNQAMSVRT